MEGVFFLFFDLLVIVLVMRVEDFERGRPRERMRRGVRRIVVKGTTIRVIHLNFRNICSSLPDKKAGQIIRTNHSNIDSNVTTRPHQ